MGLVSRRVTSDEQLRVRIEAEFREMPELSLTVSQARRLWATERAECVQVLSDLVDAGVLRHTSDGRYCRRHGGEVCTWRQRQA
jgi:hypothetical protein